MPHTDRGTHRLHYEVLGDPGAPPLLLVMGMSMSSGAWYTLPSRLAARFRVVLFDNVGTGRSSQVPAQFRMRDLADDARAVLDAAGVGSSFVFGVSMGGMIAQELALRHPAHVRGLSLGCTFGSYLFSRKPDARTVAEMTFRSIVPRDPEDPEQAFQVGRILVSRDFMRREPERYLAWYRRAGHAPRKTVRAQLRAVWMHHAEGRLRKLPFPTLVLTGDDDKLVHADNSRRLARILPNARLVELPGAGHCFQLEREEETARALTQHFLGRA